MAINFPSSPIAGATFAVGKVLYTFTAGAWQPAPLQTARPANLLANGSFMASQEKGNASLPVATGPDQWFNSGTLPPNFTAQRLASASPNGSPYILNTVVSTQKLSLAVGDYLAFFQQIEGIRMARVFGGTTQMTRMVLRFWLKAPAGTISATIRAGIGPFRCYSMPIVTTAGEANVWKERSIAIPADTDINAYWASDTSISITLWLTIACGGTYITPADLVWSTGNFICGPSITNGAAVVGNNYSFADVGLYRDIAGNGVAPPFELQTEADALLEARRYWQLRPDALGTSSSATLLGRVGVPLTPQMRIPPALAIQGAPTAYDVAVNNAMGAISGSFSSRDHMEFNAAATGLTVNRAAMMLGNQTVTNAIICNARF